MLEITKRIEVEVDENRHHFRIAHETFSMAVFTSIRCFERIFLYLSIIFFAKIIDNTENFSNFVLGYHREYFCFICLFCHYKDSKNSLIYKFSMTYVIVACNRKLLQKEQRKGIRLSRTHVIRCRILFALVRRDCFMKGFEFIVRKKFAEQVHWVESRADVPFSLSQS